MAFTLSSMFSQPQQQAAYNPSSATNWGNPQGGLGQDVLNFFNNQQPSAPGVIDFSKSVYALPGSAYDPTKALQAHNGSNMPGTVGRYSLGGGGEPIRFDIGENGPTTWIDPGPAQMGYMYTPLGSNPGHAGDPYYVYNPDGSFKEAKSFEKDPMSNPLMGVASVVGAGLGMGALFGGLGGAMGGLAGGGEAAGGAGMAEGANIGAANALSDAAAYGSLPGSAWAPSTGGLAAGALGGGAEGAAGGALTGVPPPAYPGAGGGGLSSLFGGGGGMSSTLGRLGMSGLSSLLGGGGGVPSNAPGGGIGGGGQGGFDMSGLAGALGPLAGGLMSAQRQGDAAQKMMAWLNGQQQRIDNLYAPNSPEYNYMFDQMSRQDAAAGRNSQYGPRSVDLAAKIAQIKADENARLAASFARPYSEALNQNAGRFQGLFGALGNTGANGSLGGLANTLFGGGGPLASGMPPNPFYNGGSGQPMDPSMFGGAGGGGLLPGQIPDNYWDMGEQNININDWFG
jgi:hypothetical protein